MTRKSAFLLIWIMFSSITFAEDIRVNIVDIIEVSKDKLAGSSIFLGPDDAAAISLDRDIRFIRGIELELTAPQLWLAHHGSLAVALYASPNKTLVKGNNEIAARQLRMDVMANRIQTVYQLPVRKNHNLRSSPYITFLPEILPVEFPLIMRIMPIVREIGEDVSAMRFQLNIKPILSDEGAVKINLRYPPNLQNKPFTMIIDDAIIEAPLEEHIFKAGEHHLMLLSNDYRNESRRFVIERGKSIELTINLQDLTPLIIFEAPDNARIFLDNIRFQNATVPKPVDPGPHEVKIQVSDYTIIKSLYIQKGKTYRVSFTLDLVVLEEY